jgi:hypothetical protein
LEEGRGARIITLFYIKVGEEICGLGHRETVRSQRFFTKRQRPFIKWLGAAIVPEVVINNGKVMKCLGSLSL